MSEEPRTQFNILWADKGHILFESQTRKDIAHIVQRSEDGERWTCSCEDARLSLNPRCKHVQEAERIHELARKLTES